MTKKRVTIRQYAKQNGHKVIGKLKKGFRETCTIRGEDEVFQTYFDEGGNEYYIDWKGDCVCITNSIGDVI